MTGRSLLPSRECFALARALSAHAGHLRAALQGAEPGAPATSLVGRDEATLRAAGLPASSARWLSAPDERLVDDDRAWALAQGIQLLLFDDATAYPPSLRAVEDAPLALWVRGDPALLRSEQLAIVGSRHPTAAGERHARRFGRELAQAGLTVTSGLARGIDAAAHEGTLDAAGRTIAVCGTGLDECYPRRNAGLAARIAAAGGAMVSEFPPGTPPRPDHFPRRNRVISGLSQGVLVVEAARDSGSLITARLAGEQGRRILAVPGSIDSPVAAGCHRLIRDGAVLATCVADVLLELRGVEKISYQIQLLMETEYPRVGVRRLDKPLEMLLDALGFEPASIDDLIARTGHTAQEIAIGLGWLTLEGLVETLPGGRYGRLLPPTGSELT